MPSLPWHSAFLVEAVMDMYTNTSARIKIGQDLSEPAVHHLFRCCKETPWLPSSSSLSWTRSLENSTDWVYPLQTSKHPLPRSASSISRCPRNQRQQDLVFAHGRSLTLPSGDPPIDAENFVYLGGKVANRDNALAARKISAWVAAIKLSRLFNSSASESNQSYIF